NFTAALIDAAGWGLGLGIVSHDTFLPMFVSDLHGSHYAVGLIKTLLAFGWYVPGIVVAGGIRGGGGGGGGGGGRAVLLGGCFCWRWRRSVCGWATAIGRRCSGRSFCAGAG